MSAAVQSRMGTIEEYQLKLEEMYDKHQLMPRVRQWFKERTDIPFATAMRNAGIPEKFGFDLLAQIAVHKRANVPTLVGCLRRHCDTAQEVADLLEVAVNANFLMFQFSQTRRGAEGEFVVVYDISPELQRALDVFQYPLPMVVEPLPVEDNLSTGYLSSRGSVILRDNHHDGDVCLDHLNRMNRVRLSINRDVARTIQNKWKGLDKKDPDETYEDYTRRQKAFDKYCRVADQVCDILVNAGNELHLTHAFDFRGRTYCRGFHVTYQGTDWNKAMLELSDREMIEE